MGFLTQLTKPKISHEVPDQPAEGGMITTYKVVGLWGENGRVLAPARIVIDTDTGQHCEKPGDVLKLTRLEAAVLGKTVVLQPILTPDGVFK